MREIKFRAWDNMHNEMVYDALFFRHSPAQKIDDLEFPDTYSPVVATPTIAQLTDFMQFTGLHDKNGKEIYEGDVVVNDHRNSGKPMPVVRDKDGSWCGDYGLRWSLFHEIDQVEVIGNVWEHPNLLEGNE